MSCECIRLSFVGDVGDGVVEVVVFVMNVNGVWTNIQIKTKIDEN